MIEEIQDEPWEDSSFDRALGELLAKYEGEANKFIQATLGFLKRKSNFFKEGDPKQRVLEAYRVVSGPRQAWDQSACCFNTVFMNTNRHNHSVRKG